MKKIIGLAKIGGGKILDKAQGPLVGNPKSQKEAKS